MNSYSLPSENFFVGWYDNYGRKFPWRKKRTRPFEFLVTEVLLRQTRAESVARIWREFTKKYRNPEIINLTEIDALSNDIRILGFYNQRARDLKNIARWLIENSKGKLPDNLDLLIKMPGVGQYSARAVLCFAFKKREAIVDTNIIRFFSRYFGIVYKYPDIRRNRWAWEIAEGLLPDDDIKVSAHNYGLLDFTGTICTARKPNHTICPLGSTCKYLQE
jgi:A/G-specific adenine glycosylase